LSLAWLGKDKQLGLHYLHSQLVGVLENDRSSGIGELLKLQQKDFAIQNGIELIKWTFDPIKTRNANLNIKKLRGIIRNYLPDYYETLTGSQNKGLPTDRFAVEWYINSNRVNSSSSTALTGLQVINQLTIDEDRNKALTSYELTANDGELLFEVPLNLETVVGEHFETAKRWQDGMRECFSNYFNKGYILDDFIFAGDGKDRRAFYKLNKRSLQDILQIDSVKKPL